MIPLHHARHNTSTLGKTSPVPPRERAIGPSSSSLPDPALHSVSSTASSTSAKPGRRDTETPPSHPTVQPNFATPAQLHVLAVHALIGAPSIEANITP